MALPTSIVLGRTAVKESDRTLTLRVAYLP